MMPNEFDLILPNFLAFILSKSKRYILMDSIMANSKQQQKRKVYRLVIQRMKQKEVHFQSA